MLVPSLLIAVALAACSAAGSNSTLPQPAPQSAAQSSEEATGTLTITLPRSVTDQLREPFYISMGTAKAALFIDSATTAAGTTTCTTTCTLSWKTTRGTHTFRAEIANSSNVVLAEGAHSYTIFAGANGALANLTVNGVAAQMSWVSNTSSTSSSITGKYALLDSSSFPITTAGSSSSFDNATINFGTSASGLTGTPSFTPATQTAPDAAGNDYTFTASCNGTSGSGTFSINATPGSSAGGISAGQLSNVSATYPSSITVTGMNNYTCSSGVIQAPPQTLYLRTTQSTVVSGNTNVREMSMTQGSSTDTTSTTINHAKNTGTWQFIPGTAPNTTLYTLSTTPNSKGWIFDGSTPGTYANANWTFTFEGLNTQKKGTMEIMVSLWKVTASSTAVTSVTQIAEGAASPSFTPSTSATTATVTISSPGAVTLAANQYLYLEVYLDVTTAADASSSTESISLNDNGANASRLVTPSFGP